MGLYMLGNFVFWLDDHNSPAIFEDWQEHEEPISLWSSPFVLSFVNKIISMLQNYFSYCVTSIWLVFFSSRKHVLWKKNWKAWNERILNPVLSRIYCLVGMSCKCLEDGGLNGIWWFLSHSCWVLSLLASYGHYCIHPHLKIKNTSQNSSTIKLDHGLKSF